MHRDRSGYGSIEARRGRMFAVAALLAVCAPGHRASAQDPVLRARALEPTAPINLWVPAGSVRIVAWDRDSIEVRGRLGAGDELRFGGTARGIKLLVEEPTERAGGRPGRLVLHVPRRSRVSVKTASASIVASDVSGTFSSSTGSIRLTGSTAAVEAESVSGDIELGLVAPWVRARTGDGHLIVRGAPDDVDVSTVGGTLDVLTSTILRGRFATVSGDIRYAASPSPEALLEMSTHAGEVQLRLPAATAGIFELSTILGQIDNGISRIAPARGTAQRGQSLRVTLGSGGARVTVRTFRGTIRLTKS